MNSGIEPATGTYAPNGLAAGMGISQSLDRNPLPTNSISIAIALD
jgi:hypothetical protein